jgi:hypothetical protein
LRAWQVGRQKMPVVRTQAKKRHEGLVIEGGDEGQAALPHQAHAHVEALGGGAVKDHLAAVLPGGLGLRGAGVARHDHRRADPQDAGRVREPLGGVAGREGDDAGPALRLVERVELVEHAARLEGARLLEELGLQVHVPVQQLAEGPGAPERRAMHVRADPVAGDPDVVERDHARDLSLAAHCSAR